MLFDLASQSVSKVEHVVSRARLIHHGLLHELSCPGEVIDVLLDAVSLRVLIVFALEVVDG